MRVIKIRHKDGVVGMQVRILFVRFWLWLPGDDAAMLARALEGKR